MNLIFIYSRIISKNIKRTFEVSWIHMTLKIIIGILLFTIR